MKNYLPIGLLFVVVLIWGCGESFVVDEKTTFDQKEWSYDNVLDYKLSVTDTSKRYNLFLEIDHTTDYEFQNIYMNVYTKYPSGKEIKQPLNLDLAEVVGKWKGECKGERCKALVVLQQNTYFNELGVHYFKFEQNTRTKNLPYINSISFRVQEVSE